MTPDTRTTPEALPLREGEHIHHCSCRPIEEQIPNGTDGGKGSGPYGRLTGLPTDDKVGRTPFCPHGNFVMNCKWCPS